MKRLFAVILTVLLTMAVCLTLSGCDKPKVRVESVLNISGDFKGTRTVTVAFPLSSDIDSIKEDILADAPAKNTEGVSFSYIGATEAGYCFELKLSFGSKSQYEEQMEAVIGRDANAILADKESVMFSGIRLREDFDVREIVEWIARDTAAAASTKDFTFEYPYNKVIVGSRTFDTGSTVDISDCKGIPVKSVEIKTYNEKVGFSGFTMNRLFDRSFVFAIPAESYAANKQKINDYFEELVGDDAQISDTHEGNNILFTVTFEGMSLSSIEELTGKVMGSGSVGIYYGDKENMSTPLFQGGMLEESLDTLSFCGTDNDPPKLKYTYSLSSNSVNREGAVFENGSWIGRGLWDDEDGAYRLEDSSGVIRLRIYDGVQYRISGVDFTLESLGDRQFRRTTSFLYPKSDGTDGPIYAEQYFKSKKVVSEYTGDGDNIVCTVISEGTIDEINEQLKDLFGKDNYLEYNQRFGALSDKTVCVDHIDIRGILSMDNLQVPMTYTVSAENGENIVTLINGSSETAYKDKDSSRTEIVGGKADVGYHGVIPKIGNILVYIIVGFTLVGSVILLASRMLYAPIRSRRAETLPGGLLPEHSAQPAIIPRDDTPSYAPSQTTTFSIFELGVLSRNKKYADEIDRDVEERLHADRLEQRKKELRQKELEEMERKVYGEKQQPDPQPVSEAQPDDTPRTVEILETFDKASREAPAPAETADPINLLDLMNGEDDDD